LCFFFFSFRPQVRAMHPFLIVIENFSASTERLPFYRWGLSFPPKQSQLHQRRLCVLICRAGHSRAGVRNLPAIRTCVRVVDMG
jgi:hypothetical protein